MEDLRLDLLPKIRQMAITHAGGRHLIESFDFLMDFARKHLPDKFFLENEINVSLRNILAREMVGNTLMHREFSSTYAAKFVIERDKMYVENASRAVKQGTITPENLEPNPKNPIITSFFRNIGRADRLGSGVRNLFKYCQFYSGQIPVFKEGYVFRIVVPLDEEYSFDYGTNNRNGIKTGVKTSEKTGVKLTETEQKILKVIKENPAITQKELSEILRLSNSGIRYVIKGLKEKELLYRSGSRRNGEWKIL